MYLSSCTCTSLVVHVPLQLCMYISSCACTYLAVYVPLQLCMYLSSCVCTSLAVYVPLQLCMYLSSFACTSLALYVPLQLCMYLSSSVVYVVSYQAYFKLNEINEINIGTSHTALIYSVKVYHVQGNRKNKEPDNLLLGFYFREKSFNTMGACQWSPYISVI